MERTEGRASRTGSAAGSAGAAASIGANLSASSRTYDLYDAEVDVNREKRTQRHLGAMASAQVLCVCPLMILRLARMTLVETYENQAHFDITYLMFVWIAFLPTVIVPWIYASWMLSRPAKERLRGYLRLSSRRNTKSEQSVDDGGGNSSPPGVKTPLSIQTSSSVGNHHPHQHQQPSKPPPQESSLVQKPSVKKQLPSIDRSKSPAGGSTRTQQSTLESTLAESSISNATTATAKSAVQSAPNGRPRRQLPPPLRIDNSNFHKTPSVKSRGSGGVQRSSLRSTAGRVGRTVGENLVDEEDDYAGSNITSSTYCNINEREVVAPPELYESMPLPRQNVLHKSASPYYQSDPNGREAHDMDSDSDIYQRQRPTRYGSLSKQDSGIVPHKPAGTPSIISISESEYSSRKGSLSTLSRDLEIIDRLERERSMDIQEMLQREKNYEYYLARQNSKLKFSTNFDDYFDEEPTQQQQQQKLPLVKQSSNSSHVPSQRSVSPHVPRNASNRRSSNLSYASTKRDSGYEQSLLETPPVAAPPVLTPGSHSASAAASSYRSNGPRRSLELEKQRIGRTYSGHSMRSSTRSRDRVSFHDDV
ncbi:hypothetical protein pipiens_009733 [Culex pipiens pipiens]|uniref:Uncharacterized protein n=1 Tax=Culex pipiens pipiens TaxID=38569 RepID=A0ABD1DDV9_CULPP